MHKKIGVLLKNNQVGVDRKIQLKVVPRVVPREVPCENI